MSKVWFITGTSSGFGFAFVKAALEQGDNVIAVSRNTHPLSILQEKYGNRLLVEKLDVTNRKKVFDVVNRAKNHFGKLDIVLSNAGYLHFGPVEELTEQELRNQMETNFFGSVNVIQAVLPILREQGAGHILQVTSVGGVVASSFVSAYHASKYALEGFLTAMAAEVEKFGIKTTMIEPGSFGTNLVGTSSVTEIRLPAYKEDFELFLENSNNHIGEPPNNAAKIIMRVVQSRNPPRHLLIGKDITAIVKQVYEQKLAVWSEWENA
ncbi:short chain dehydrogenase [Treponema primitia ZAS-2]|uniref:Short chain dehydrogenase n=1 Tax=Treponema primitia (strain ATCC BAA-887 / DSM 12427 / ZAS-2) TaxID=545694 RepID=F5YJ27_TREPZ|nr:SDR family NAD(P)-dependent oxidoreductase [Treponema primitia]AEF84842.1 short chain dehydrogenase [Treponema primitia ZAS-2]